MSRISGSYSKAKQLATLAGLFLAMPLPLASAQDGPPRTAGIVAVLAVDTESGPLGTAQSGQSMLDACKFIGAMGIEIEVTRIDPKRMLPGEIIAAVKRLDMNKLATRTLFFYYAGHGGTDPRVGHVLLPGRHSLPNLQDGRSSSADRDRSAEDN